MHGKSLRLIVLLFIIGWGVGLLSACATPSEPPSTTETTDETLDAEAMMLMLPDLQTAVSQERPLNVVATTGIIGDVVAQVGGDAIQLTTLIGAGQDPHSYQPGAQELTAVANADVIFINGWDLEESLIQNLQSIGQDVPIVPISANIVPLVIDDAEHGHSGADPHVWFNIDNVAQWVTNTEVVLSSLDPANAAIYQTQADDYLKELAELARFVDTQIATIAPENRFLVTNHDSLNYFAHAYDFELVGTIIPGVSTMAEPSASDLAQLIAKMKDYQVCTIFTETAVSEKLAQTVFAELDNCAQIQVIPLYTGSMGTADEGTASYIGMMRANITSIVDGLK